MARPVLVRTSANLGLQCCQSSRWCFTLNNPALLAYDPKGFPDVKYITWQLETGENGTPHWQGAVFFSKNKRFNAVKRIMPEAHWEVMRGSAKQAIDYCQKADTRTDGPWEMGEAPLHRGKRTDLISLHESVMNGDSIDDIMDTHGHTIMKVPRGYTLIANHYQMKNIPSFRILSVSVYWGPTGVGKTRRVHEEAPDVYVVDNYPWYDGYTNQDAICLDDFYGSIPCHVLLRLLDGYKLQLPIKGGFTSANWTKVFITSNCPPDEWYSKLSTYNGIGSRVSSIPDEVRAAMMRRITNIVEMK